MSAALGRLAELMGIVPQFTDARGRCIRPSDDTKRQLLRAMGLEVTDEQQVCRHLQELERAEWLRPLPPVKVIKATSRPPNVELVLPADALEFSWRLTLEDGSERTGKVLFSDLKFIAGRELDGRRLQRRLFPLPSDVPDGYHKLAIAPDAAEMSLIMCPDRCYLPPGLAEGYRLWGIAAQLYLLRTEQNWGIGDFRDLSELVKIASDRGAGLIGLNPLHALFPDNPEQASPYSPASRLLLNVLNIDVRAVVEMTRSVKATEAMCSEAFAEQLNKLRALSLVDYSGVAALKLHVLKLCFESFLNGAEEESCGAFAMYRKERGAGLERACLFLALREHFASIESAQRDWHLWPEAYQDPQSPAVALFAREQRHQIDFLAWLQWVAERQLEHAATTARARGMSIGLYRDLAVGADRAGVETWASRNAVVSGAQIGAPPDIFNPKGQDWGLPPFHPQRLREERYESFVQLVRTNMRHAGGLRIDHVMGLQQLYWVPRGEKPEAGAYMRYPVEDLVGILALESQRQSCLVVGEDLGTVPEGFRERMAAANILSYRVLFFQQDSNTGRFTPPGAYPGEALAVIGSHDLPTLRGWWEGRDLDLKEKLNLYPDASEAMQQRETRARDRAELLDALRRESLIESGGEPDIPTLARAAHRYLARSKSILAVAQIDDLTDEVDPVNVPATSVEHPNWRRRLSMSLSELAVRPRFLDVTAIFSSERGGTKPLSTAGLQQ